MTIIRKLIVFYKSPDLTFIKVKPIVTEWRRIASEILAIIGSTVLMMTTLMVIFIDTTTIMIITNSRKIEWLFNDNTSQNWVQLNPVETLLSITQYCTNFSYCSDVIMNTMASQITGVSIVCSIVCSDADQRKYQSSVPLDFVRGSHRWPMHSPNKGPVTRKIFPFDDVIMETKDIWRRSHSEQRRDTEDT